MLSFPVQYDKKAGRVVANGWCCFFSWPIFFNGVMVMHLNGIKLGRSSKFLKAK